VEYVKRFYAEALGVDTSAWIGNAERYFDTASEKGLHAFDNGHSLSPPQPDDILVFSGGPFGHVAIVTGISTDSVSVIEQNWSRTGTATIAIGQDALIGTWTLGQRGRLKVVGWLRRPPTGATIQGFVRLTDGSGFSVDNTTVSAYDADFNLVAQTQSDASGAYSLTVPPGTYALDAFKQITASTFLSGFVADPLSVNAGQTITQDIPVVFIAPF
jgi:hypothetical protein